MIDTYISAFVSAYSRYQDMEAGVAALKAAGASQVESVVVLVKALKLPLSEADKIVLNTAIWTENKAYALDFRVRFADFLENDETVYDNN